MPATNSVTITVLFSLFLLSHATSDASISIAAVDLKDVEPHRTVVLRPARPAGPIDPDLIAHSFRRHDGRIGLHVNHRLGRDIPTELMETVRKDEIEPDGEEQKQIVMKRKNDDDELKKRRRRKVEMKERDGELELEKITKKSREFKHERDMKKKLKKKKKMKLRMEKEIDKKLKPMKERKDVDDGDDELKERKNDDDELKKRRRRRKVEMKERDGELELKKITKKSREFKHERDVKKKLKKKKKKLRMEKEIDKKLKPMKERKDVDDGDDELKASKHKKRVMEKMRNAAKTKASKPLCFADRVRHFFKHLF